MHSRRSIVGIDARLEVGGDVGLAYHRGGLVGVRVRVRVRD